MYVNQRERFEGLSQVHLLRYGNHILILGWSEKTLYLLNELFEALRSSGDFSVSVVVLAEREVSEMQQEVQQHFYQIWEGLSFFDRRGQLCLGISWLWGESLKSQKIISFPV